MYILLTEIKSLFQQKIKTMKANLKHLHLRRRNLLEGNAVVHFLKVIKAICLLLALLFPVKAFNQSPVKVFTVNTLGDASDPNAGEIGDDGHCDTDPLTPGDQCTFRAAIQNHNGNRNLGQNEIDFSIPNAPGTGSILIAVGNSGLGPLPPVLGSVIINGKNQADGRRIELDGTAAGANAKGLQLLGGPCLVTSFIINNFLHMEYSSPEHHLPAMAEML